jgi:hypothetical protein
MVAKLKLRTSSVARASAAPVRAREPQGTFMPSRAGPEAREARANLPSHEMAISQSAPISTKATVPGRLLSRGARLPETASPTAKLETSGATRALASGEMLGLSARREMSGRRFNTVQQGT